MVLGEEVGVLSKLRSIPRVLVPATVPTRLTTVIAIEIG
jgi:hypothetical protein